MHVHVRGWRRSTCASDRAAAHVGLVAYLKRVEDIISARAMMFSIPMMSKSKPAGLAGAPGRPGACGRPPPARPRSGCRSGRSGSMACSVPRTMLTSNIASRWGEGARLCVGAWLKRPKMLLTTSESPVCRKLAEARSSASHRCCEGTATGHTAACGLAGSASGSAGRHGAEGPGEFMAGCLLRAPRSFEERAHHVAAAEMNEAEGRSAGLGFRTLSRRRVRDATDGGEQHRIRTFRVHAELASPLTTSAGRLTRRHGPRQAAGRRSDGR